MMIYSILIKILLLFKKKIIIAHIVSVDFFLSFLSIYLSIYKTTRGQDNVKKKKQWPVPGSTEI